MDLVELTYIRDDILHTVIVDKKQIRDIKKNANIKIASVKSAPIETERDYILR